MSRTRLLGIAVVAVTSVLAGVATASRAAETPTNSRPRASADRATSHRSGDAATSWTCPVKLHGAKVAEFDVDGGAALTFSTDKDRVSALRGQVRSMAAMYDQHVESSPWMRMRDPSESPEVEVGTANTKGNEVGHEASSRVSKLRGEIAYDLSGRPMMLPASKATVENTADGAVLILRPLEPSQLVALRESAWAQAGVIASGKCPPIALPRAQHVAALAAAPRSRS